MDKTYNEDENFNPPTKLGRRNSILKSTDLGKTINMDDETTEETTRMRKSRRVSFSAKIHIQEIENNHDLKTDLITLVNTQANSIRTNTVMADISNTNARNSPSQTALPAPALSKQPSLDSSDMILSDGSSLIRMNDTSEINLLDYTQNNETLMVDTSYVAKSKSEPPSLPPIQKGGDETMCDFSSNQTIFANRTKLLNQTMDLVSSSSNETICGFNSNQTVLMHTLHNDLSISNETQFDSNQTRINEETMLNYSSNQTAMFGNGTKLNNETMLNFTMNNKTKLSDETVVDFSSNQTTMFGNRTKFNDETSVDFSTNQTTMFSNRTKLNDETALNFSSNQTTAFVNRTRLNEETALDFSANRTKMNEETMLNHSSNQMINNKLTDLTNQSMKSINETLNQTVDVAILKQLECVSLKDYQGEIVSEIKAFVPRMREQLELVREQARLARERKSQRDLKRERELKENAALKQLDKELDMKIIELREELKQLKENADPLYFMATKEKCDDLEKRVKESSEENVKLKKKYEKSVEKLNEARENVKVKYKELESLKRSKTTNEKFIDLCQDIFSDEFIDYKIIYMEKDTILLSFFYDFIQLEIQATNIANDISSEGTGSSSSNNSSNTCENYLFKDSKCLNYPILKLVTRSTIDSAKSSSSISTPYYSTNEDKKSLKKKTRKNVPIFIQYCVDLVLKEIGEGDLLETNKKYKYIRDIPMLITHLSLACKCASNLAKDFEYFSQISVDTQVKCDFDFKNHFASLKLPSLEDACYYKLKLNILPGKYYQEGIPFSIESLDPNDICQPNIEQISKVVEGQYFEDGSLKNYLKRLKLV